MHNVILDSIFVSILRLKHFMLSKITKKESKVTNIGKIKTLFQLIEEIGVYKTILLLCLKILK